MNLYKLCILLLLSTQTFAMTIEQQNLVRSIHYRGHNAMITLSSQRGGYDLLSYCFMGKMLNEDKKSQGRITPVGHSIDSLVKTASKAGSSTSDYLTELESLKSDLEPFVQKVSQQEYCISEGLNWTAPFKRIEDFVDNNPGYSLDTDTVFSIIALLKQFEENVINDLEEKGLLEVTGEVDYTSNKAPIKF